MMDKRTLSLLLCTAFSLNLAACATKKDPDAPPPPVETLYGQAEAEFKDGNYLKASQLYDDVDRNYPYSAMATEAQMMAAYALYKDKRYDEAVLALDRYIELHPGNEKVDYAYYLKALSYYEQISDVRRDQQMTRNAMDALDTLIARFPNSTYARDAQLKKDLVLDHLAGAEMEIGRYYLDRGYYNAAINRFQDVVQNYQTTTHVPEALHRLVESYLTLGLKEEAVHVAAVLGHNYPGSTWYQDSYALLDPDARARLKDDRSWINRAVDSIL